MPEKPSKGSPEKGKPKKQRKRGKKKGGNTEKGDDASPTVTPSKTKFAEAPPQSQTEASLETQHEKEEGTIEQEANSAHQSVVGNEDPLQPLPCQFVDDADAPPHIKVNLTSHCPCHDHASSTTVAALTTSATVIGEEDEEGEHNDPNDCSSSVADPSLCHYESSGAFVMDDNSSSHQSRSKGDDPPSDAEESNDDLHGAIQRVHAPIAIVEILSDPVLAGMSASSGTNASTVAFCDDTNINSSSASNPTKNTPIPLSTMENETDKKSSCKIPTIPPPPAVGDQVLLYYCYYCQEKLPAAAFHDVSQIELQLHESVDDVDPECRDLRLCLSCNVSIQAREEKVHVSATKLLQQLANSESPALVEDPDLRSNNKMEDIGAHSNGKGPDGYLVIPGLCPLCGDSLQGEEKGWYAAATGTVEQRTYSWLQELGVEDGDNHHDWFFSCSKHSQSDLPCPWGDGAHPGMMGVVWNQAIESAPLALRQKANTIAMSESFFRSDGDDGYLDSIDGEEDAIALARYLTDSATSSVAGAPFVR